MDRAAGAVRPDRRGRPPRFDGEVADAVAAFCAQYGMEPALYASTELLEALDDAVQVLDGTTYLLDDQLQLALTMCQLAAEKAPAVHRAAGRQLDRGSELTKRPSQEEDHIGNTLVPA